MAVRAHDRPQSAAPERPRLIGNIIWLIVAGIWLAIGNAVAGVALCITIIGIPLGLACFKLIPISLVPLGKIIVPTDSVAAYEALLGPSRVSNEVITSLPIQQDEYEHRGLA